MADISVGELEDELVGDLTVELELADENFDATLLTQKISAAIRDVKRARHYPSYYTDTQIGNDLYEYYPNIRSIALYDYNKISMEHEDTHNENSVNVSFTDRNKLFTGIIPLAR